MRNARKVLAGIRDGKRPLGKRGHIQKKLKEIGWKVVG
jgi:hypothetical protein